MLTSDSSDSSVSSDSSDASDSQLPPQKISKTTPHPRFPVITRQRKKLLDEYRQSINKAKLLQRRLFKTSDSESDGEWEDVDPTSLSTLKRIPNLQDLRDINNTRNKSKKSSQTPRRSKKSPVKQTPAKGKPSISTMATTHVKLKDAIATIPKFDRATMSLEDFLDSIEYAKEIIDSAEEALLVKLVRTKIGEEARKGLKDIDIQTVAELKKQLRGLYSSGLTVSALQGLLAQQLQQPGESVLSFATKIRDLGNQIIQTKKLSLATGATIPKDFEEKVKGSQEECFRKGLLDNISVRMKSTGSLTDLIKEAITIEKDLEVKSMMRRKLEKRCGNCGRTNHATEQCRVKRVNTVVTTTNNTHSNAHGNTSKKICTYCKKPGHLVDKCFKYVYDQVQKAKGSSKPLADSNAQSPCVKCGKSNHTTERCLNHLVCSYCHHNGHLIEDCRKRKVALAKNSQARPNQNAQETSNETKPRSQSTTSEDQLLKELIATL
uniref:CCHC-type domain-containing protein n=1 Tax=Trichogramma kaykai TaxID=54128 RepID=A0ABD2WI68_9HYME